MITTTEIILCIFFIPFNFILWYLMGKNDVIGVISKMIEEKAKKLNESEENRQCK